MKTQSINFYRGESTSITLTIEGQYDNHDLVFVVKANNNQESPRVIEKKLSRGEITILSYDAETNLTTIKISMSISDTADLKIKKYVFDIDSINLSNTEEVQTCIYGNFNLTADVQTPSDGYETPETAKRFITISADDGNVGDIVQIQLNSNNEKVFKLISLMELKSQLNNI